MSGLGRPFCWGAYAPWWNKKKPAAPYSRAGGSRTTLGEEALDFRVRDGNGYDSLSMATGRKPFRLELKGTAAQRGGSPHLSEVRRVYWVPPDPFPRRGKAKPHDGLVPLGSTHRCAFTCGLSRPWSTARLEGLAPGRSCLGGGLALRCFQRLSVPGIATGRAAGATARTPWARDSRSSRTRESSPQISCAHRG